MIQINLDDHLGNDSNFNKVTLKIRVYFNFKKVSLFIDINYLLNLKNNYLFHQT
jgi:hypothetical protein